MKIYSEKTKKWYPMEEQEVCEAEEREFDEKMAKIAEEKAREAQYRKERAQEVEDAYKASREAEAKYLELRNKFVNDFGSFHMTFSNKEKPATLEELLHSLFMF